MKNLPHYSMLRNCCDDLLYSLDLGRWYKVVTMSSWGHGLYHPNLQVVVFLRLLTRGGGMASKVGQRIRGMVGLFTYCRKNEFWMEPGPSPTNIFLQLYIRIWGAQIRINTNFQEVVKGGPKCLKKSGKHVTSYSLRLFCIVRPHMLNGCFLGLHFVWHTKIYWRVIRQSVKM